MLIVVLYRWRMWHCMLFSQKCGTMGFSVIHSLYKLFDQKLEFDKASFKLEYSSAKWVRFLVCKNWFIETKSVSGFRLMNLGTRWLV